MWSDEATLSHISRLARLFVAFRPYRRSLMGEAAARGWPLVRHPYMHYPADVTLREDAEAGWPDHALTPRMRQFMLGSEWMVRVARATPGLTWPSY